MVNLKYIFDIFVDNIIWLVVSTLFLMLFIPISALRSVYFLHKNNLAGVAGGASKFFAYRFLEIYQFKKLRHGEFKNTYKSPSGTSQVCKATDIELENFGYIEKYTEVNGIEHVRIKSRQQIVTSFLDKFKNFLMYKMLLQVSKYVYIDSDKLFGN